mgnify:CR=1 FL=1
MRLAHTISTLFVLSIATSSSAIAVDSCGGYTSKGNPFPCGGGGNCTWWAWKMAKDNLKVDFPARGNANTWDDTARSKSSYKVSSTAASNAIAEKESSPYCVSYDNKGKCKKFEDQGHVAFVTSVKKDKKGKITDVTVSQMYWGVAGVSVKTYKADYFNNYITKK